MSTEPVGGQLTHARNGVPQPARSAAAPDAGGGEPLEFVRFCYRRRRVSWPALYDEMCAVAARGQYRGLGYAELAEQGVSFCLSELPRLAALTELVINEERGRVEARAEHVLSAPLSVAQATG